jgi:DHA1 family bicyclomycin/chloramphenicol resistance-like MFS transporter
MPRTSIGLAEGRAAPSALGRSRTRGGLTLFILIAITALAPAALHMLVPSLPLLARVFAGTSGGVQLVLTVFLAGIAVGQLVYGPVSDRFGRRPVLIAGLALFLLGTLLCGLAWSLPVLILGRALEACGGCAGMVLSRAIVRDLFDRNRAARAIAMISMAMTFAPSLAPAVGAYLAEAAGWRADFALLGLLGTAVLILVSARLPETRARGAAPGRAGMIWAFVTLLSSPGFLGFALATSFTSASWFTFLASAPYLLAELMHEPPSTYGWMILLPMAGYMLGSGAAARFALHLESSRLFLCGLYLSLASGAILILWPFLVPLSPSALFVPMALSSIGNGLSQPPGIAAGLSLYPRIAGAASGLLGFLQMMTAALGTFLVGQLPRGSALPANLVVGACLALALVFGIVAIGRERRLGRA